MIQCRPIRKQAKSIKSSFIRPYIYSMYISLRKFCFTTTCTLQTETMQETCYIYGKYSKYLRVWVNRNYTVVLHGYVVVEAFVDIFTGDCQL